MFYISAFFLAFFLCNREGTLKVGDRILSIDGVNVTQSSLAEALAILKHSEDETHLLVEYDVSVIGM